ncbi:polyamine deacetylase HDAC10-like [Eriocheir sinensis]|uniref:polyamine deacetylase HDAC10-like n=1 Tax=Eriocheir sinensis TaxID=95602 RepID=UPI0021C9EC7B|nr:polyamine deacetylase HDAC10-like [Eriocheir sinensis]
MFVPYASRPDTPCMQLLTPQTQQLRERIDKKLLQLRKEASVAQGEEVELTHSQEHMAFMFSLQAQGEEELQTLQENYKSVYLHPATYACALLSAGSLLRVVDEVFAGRDRAGVGIIRSPATTPSQTAPTASASTTTWPSPPTGWDAKVGATCLALNS